MRLRRSERWICLVILAGLVVASCTGDTRDTGQSPPGIDLAEAVLERSRSAQVGDTNFLPAIAAATRHARWVEIDSRVCVRSLVSGEADSVCAAFDSETHIDLATLAWSRDGSTLLFNEDTFRFNTEPDIWAFTVATGELIKLADDETSSTGDDDALRDTAPFTSDDGVVHYFRLEGSESTLWAINADGVSGQLALDLGSVVPLQGLHRVGPDRFLVSVWNLDTSAPALALLDLAGPTLTPITLPEIRDPVIVASGDGAAIAADRGLQAIGISPYVFVGLGDTTVNPVASTELIDLHLDPSDQPTAWRPSFAMSPNGTSFVVARSAARDTLPEVLGFTWLPTGQLSEPDVLAPGGFLGTNESGQDRGINGSPTHQNMAWTADNQLLMLTSDEALLFQLTGPAQ